MPILIIKITFFIVIFGATLANKNLNVFNSPLSICSLDPLTGFTKSGKCDANKYDQGIYISILIDFISNYIINFNQGSHFVCSTVTNEFLTYTKQMGNDLITPRSGTFPGLKSGNNWCICVFRWIQAYRVGKQPPVVLEATNYETLNFFKYYGLSIKDLYENATYSPESQNKIIIDRILKNNGNEFKVITAYIIILLLIYRYLVKSAF